MSKSKVITVLIVFYNGKGVVHKEFVLQRHTVNAANYVVVLEIKKKGYPNVKGDHRYQAVAPRQWLQPYPFVHPGYPSKHNLATLPQPPLQS